MIIDFHTHVFPDKIAKRTIELLSDKANIPAHTDGSVSGLIESMAKAGVDISVALPVVTSPSQFESINRFALSINERYENQNRKIISFAGIHPACEDIQGKMRFIKAEGFLGVKLHPDYQGTYFDDEGYIKILKLAKELDLIVTTHAGIDIGFPGEPVRCTPDRVLNVLKKVNHKKLVLAHMGAAGMEKEVYDKLAGHELYLDTAYVLRFISKDLFTKILEKHGEDRILFATDCPWSSQNGDLEILNSFGLDKTTEYKILEGNARKLLHI